MVYFLIFCSGVSGLIYQVVWVRVFGNVFGNTVHSAAIVVAVFMLGMGVGSYLFGRTADRWYRDAGAHSTSLLRAYAYVELTVAVAGLVIALLLPHLGRVSALVSSYSPGASGWYVLSIGSHAARTVISVVLLAPVTLLMGGTLTLLIRHLVRTDLAVGSRRIAVLYAVNTAGAAAGCFLTDFALVPGLGLLGTQLVAVGLNLAVGAGAWALARVGAVRSVRPRTARGVRVVRRRGRSSDRPVGIRRVDWEADRPSTGTPETPYRTTHVALALAMSGFAAMGMEILWFRHLTILLGGFRAVFSLLLTVILVGIGAGSLACAFLDRRVSQPGSWLMVGQALFVASALAGLSVIDARDIGAVVAADPAYAAALGAAGPGGPTGLGRTIAELWFNGKPMLVELAVPALLMGLTFPLANAVIQLAESSVGRRAGVLYLANTAGAVGGSLAAAFLFLPSFGIQGSATALMIVGALAIVPLARATGDRRAALGSLLMASAALVAWALLPSDYVIARALARPADGERRIAMREGLTEVVEVSELPGGGQRLLTNGHPMSATTWLSQRYMRAMAHIPLLAIERPETVLVIGFGVGNTTHAVSLHPTIRRIDVADLSTDILASAGYFTATNSDVLRDPRVAVYVNDGRQHLQMQPAGAYDLITLEPPPIGYAGVAALYSREFYALARARLRPRGYVSQWLPAYQVPGATTLAMIRAFIDVFPQAVLISGAEADLLLLGVNDAAMTIDPGRLAAALSRAPAVEADLARVDLGSVKEIVGTFVGSAQQLAQATRDAAPVSDDRPIQEYGVASLLDFGGAVPASVVDLQQVVAWCPACFVDGQPVPLVDGLDTYLALLSRAYASSAAEMTRTRRAADPARRRVAGSAYLGAIVPDTADLHNILGLSLARQGRLEQAIAEFRDAVRQDPESAMTHWHLGAALASPSVIGRDGAREEAIGHLRKSLQLDPGNALVRQDLTAVLALDPRR
ncbi:MAG: fused MFS/spermidine synthase [Acidobacteriota bacterium]